MTPTNKITDRDPVANWDSWFFNEMEPMQSSLASNHIKFTPVEKVPMKADKWVVLMHSPGVGTFAPYFASIDEAEEFANSMRIVTEDTAVSEPIPVVKTESKPAPTTWINTNQELKRPNPFHAIQT